MRMKTRTKFSLLLSGLLSLLVVGCTSDNATDIPTPSGETGVAVLNLQLPLNISDGTSYAETVTGETVENTFNSVFIALVDQATDKVSAIYSHDAGTVTSSTVTLKVEGVSATPTDFDIYVLANADKAGANLTTLAGTANLTRTQLLEGFSSTISTALNPPLLMAGDTLGVSLKEDETKSIKLKVTRRMARFDINFTKAASNVVGVVVRKAKANVSLFPYNASGVANDSYSTQVAKLSTYNYQIAIPTAKQDTVVKSAFYLYPTLLKSGATEVFVQTKDGNTYSYSTANDSIKANMLYLLRATGATLEMDIESEEDWWVADTFGMGAQTGLASVSMPTTAPANTTLSGKTWTVPVNHGSEVSLAPTVYSYDYAGTTYALTGSTTGVTVSKSTVTPAYADLRYKETYTIKVKANNKTGCNATLVIYDASKEAVDTIFIVQPGNPLLKWANQNLSAVGKFVNNGTAYSSEADYGKVKSYGAWFQWGRNYAFTNAKTDSSILEKTTETKIAISRADTNKLFVLAKAAPYTWHKTTNNDYGHWNDTWYSITGKATDGGQTSGAYKGDPCPTGYRLPTVEEILEIMPVNSTAGNYTTANTGNFAAETTTAYTASGTTTEGTKTFVTSTAPAYYKSLNGKDKVLVGIKKQGTSSAYALKWEYIGTGTNVSAKGADESKADTYLKITSIPVTANVAIDSVAKTTFNWSAAAATTRFFPAAGFRRFNGMPQGRGDAGVYWTSTAKDHESAYYFCFDNAVTVSGWYRTLALSVRCVAQ